MAPQTKTWRRRKGMALMGISTEEKIRQLQAMVEGDQSDHLAYFMLGKLYLDIGRNEDAAVELENCIQLRQDYSAAYRLCGDAYRKAGNLEKAKEIYDSGIAVAEKNGDLQTVKEMKALARKLEG